MNDIQVGDLVTVDIDDLTGFWVGPFVVEKINRGAYDDSNEYNMPSINKFSDAHNCWFSLIVADFHQHLKKVTLETQRGAQEIGITR